MPPLSLLIKPASSACDMRCRYCFYADVAQNRAVGNRGNMSLATLETLVRRAFAYADGAVHFAYQGGEPTLAGIDFYRAFEGYVRKYNARNLPVQRAIQTNALHLTEEMARHLAENHYLVGVSLDGDRGLHDGMRIDADGAGTWERARENAARLRALGAEVNALCVVTREVAEAPERAFAALAPYGYVQFIPCLDPLSGEKGPHSLNAEDYGAFLCRTFDRYYEAFARGNYVSVRNFDNYVGMLAGRPPENCAMRGHCGNYYLIEGDGSVYPCDFYVLDEWRLGNIAEQSFARLEKSPLARAFREESWALPDECRDCEWRSLCRNGCKREREAGGRNRFCASYRRFFPYAMARLRELAARV